jgi:uncharacterized Zn finger protein
MAKDAHPPMQFTASDLFALTDTGSLERGVGYFEEGRVVELMRDGDGLFAKVMGRFPYTVRLWMDEEGLDGTCTCPMGESGVFCKHCVATGLTYLAEKKGTVKELEDMDDMEEAVAAREEPSRATRPAVSLDDIRAYLAEQDADALVEMLMEQVRADDRLRRRLVTKTALTRATGPDTEGLREAIRIATTIDPFDYTLPEDLLDDAQAAVDPIEELLDAGHAAEAAELAEFAMTHIEQAFEELNEGDGWIEELTQRLTDIHRRACTQAPPEPEALAQKLLDLYFQTGWYLFDDALETYADALGEQGRATYKRLAQAKWAEFPDLGPEDEYTGWDYDRRRMEHLMECIAHADGDIEARVAVKARDLSGPGRHLAIAEIWKEARQYNKAMEWAERGFEAFPDRPDPHLREFLANEYHRRSRHDEAMELVWAPFAERPSLGEYQNLKEHAERAEQWPHWRERALARIREDIPQRKKAARRRDPWGHTPDASTLVKVLLREGDADAAWREARGHGCRHDLWLELAEARQKDHPEDAVPIFQAEAEKAIQRTQRKGYREGVRYIQRIRDAMLRLGQDEKFAAYLEEVRTTHKRKRTLMGMLDRVEKQWRRRKKRGTR